MHVMVSIILAAFSRVRLGSNVLLQERDMRPAPCWTAFLLQACRAWRTYQVSFCFRRFHH